MDALDAKEQDVTQAHQRALAKREQGKQQVAAQIDLVQTIGSQLCEQALVNRDLHHGGEHDAADPQREDGVERRHGAAVVLDGIDRLALHAHRGRQRLGQALGILADDGANGVEVVLRHSRGEPVLELLQVVAGLNELVGGAGEQGVQAGKVVGERVRRAGERGDGAVQAGGDVAARAHDARNGILELRGLALQGALVITVDRADALLGLRNQVRELLLGGRHVGRARSEARCRLGDAGGNGLELRSVRVDLRSDGLELIRDLRETLFERAHRGGSLVDGGGAVVQLARDAVELGHRQRDLVGRVRESVVHRGVDGIVAARDIGDGLVDGRGCAGKRALDRRETVLGIAQQLLSIVGGGVVGHHLAARRPEHARRGRKHAHQRGGAAARILEVGDAVFKRGVEVRDEVRDLVAVHVVEQARCGGEADIADRLGERLVDL